MKTLLLLLIFNFPLSIFHFSDGLEGNPAQTRQIFSDNCAYVKNSGQNKREKYRIKQLVNNMARHSTIKNGRYLYNKKVSMKILNDKFV